MPASRVTSIYESWTIGNEYYLKKSYQVCVATSGTACEDATAMIGALPCAALDSGCTVFALFVSLFTILSPGETFFFTAN